MSDGLSLHLLGKPQVEVEGSPVTGFISAKAQGLLFYLAVTGRPHSRKALAGLMWGDMPEAQAGKNLRNVLSNLRALLEPYLVIARDEVIFNRGACYSLDVETFASELSGDIAKRDLGTLHHAVELYRGDFLEGFYAGDALEMEEWILGRRSSLNALMVQALHTLVVKHLEREEHAAGIHYATRLLEIEPWREETHRHLMLLLARSGQRSAALAQYEVCRKALASELGVEPMIETVALYQRVKAAAEPPPHNLPPQPMPAVGREAELAEIAAFLHDPHTQLLTLVGPGGIGKTRLALQAASRCVEPSAHVEPQFTDGVFFISLAAVASIGGQDSQRSLMDALAETFRLTLQGPLPAQAQVLNYLRQKDLLLILDNFDHLVPEARRLIELLRLAPRVKLLVTSRIRLHLQEEGLLEVRGLDYPGPEASPEEARPYSAVQLFLQQARRVQPGFALTAGEVPEVVRICRLVEGVPLGIELAASWLRVLSSREIANEIEASLDFLTTSFQDVPERHRSLRAVFDQSWNLLMPAEQTIFRRLSVFRGGFRREAAARVVGVSLPLLAELVDKSLLRRSAEGRYEIHDLLRQYAERRLEVEPLENEQVHDAHCRYFAELLAVHKEELTGGDVLAALSVLEAERENVRAAWNWAIGHRKIEQVNLFMECL